ncbi:MAG TPA: glycosyltransferase [Nitrososphaeraceae archaeon]|nr:glycosyltransferase [Nitrososphaeraceae archaeon]
MTQVVFRGSCLGFSGYDNTNLLYVIGMIENGVDVKLVEQLDNRDFYFQFIRKDWVELLIEAMDKPMADEYIYITRTTLDCFKPYPNAIKTYVSTVWEVDPLPDYWLEGFKNIEADGIIVPSEFNRSMIDGKTGKPIYLIREGLDLSQYNNIREEKPEGTFNFLSIFQWLPRKGYDVLLEAYFKEFQDNDDVALVIKTSSLNYGVIPSSQILSNVASIKRKFGKNLPVYILPTHTTYEEILDLYNECHSFVLPTRAEGYCRPALEAMASNLPLIITGWGGQTDFANHDNAYLLDYNLSSVPRQWYSGDFQPYQVWAEPSVEHLQSQMRRVYENRVEAKEKAKKAKQLTLEYDYRLIAKELENVLFSNL